MRKMPLDTERLDPGRVSVCLCERGGMRMQPPEAENKNECVPPTRNENEPAVVARAIQESPRLSDLAGRNGGRFTGAGPPRPP